MKYTHKNWLWIGVLLPWLALAPGLHAAESVLPQSTQVEVPVAAGNLDEAQRRAKRTAMEEALNKAVLQLVLPEWEELFHEKIKTVIYANPQNYISTYRVSEQHLSTNEKNLSLTLEVSFNQTRLAEDLRALALPLRGDPARPVLVFYAAEDALMRQAAFAQPLLAMAKERLALLNREIKAITPLDAAAAALLANPYQSQTERHAWLVQKKFASDELLFLAYVPAAPAGAPERLEAVVYHTATGDALAVIEQKPSMPLALPAPGQAANATTMAALANELGTPLLAQFQPGRIQEAEMVAGSENLLAVEVRGLSSIRDQDSFEREFLGKMLPFRKFGLYRMGRQSVVYTGNLSGNREAVVASLQNRKLGEFQILTAALKEETLTLDLRRSSTSEHAALAPYNPQALSRATSELVERYVTETPDRASLRPALAEVEDNGLFDRANRLVFNTVIYGYLDSRSDADFYMAEGLKGGEQINVTWVRISPTNMNATLRVYDQNQNLLHTAYATRAALTFSFQVPAGEKVVYLELGDRYGYLKWDSGGYLNFHYLLTVQKR